MPPSLPAFLTDFPHHPYNDNIIITKKLIKNCLFSPVSGSFQCVFSPKFMPQNLDFLKSIIAFYRFFSAFFYALKKKKLSFGLI